VRSGKIGSIGFCMSGRFVTTAARRFPERFACAVSLYGTRLVTDEENSPHLHLDGIKAEMHYGFGDLDATTPADYIETFTAALDAAKVNYTMYIFNNVDHGYAFVERAMYDADAAETSWKKTFDLFERHLR
jgi:carboxymethylenebutenolidase